MLQVPYCHFSFFSKFFHGNVHAAGSVESNANIQPGTRQYGTFGTFNENPTSEAAEAPLLSNSGRRSAAWDEL
jgi:hypothetical protein